MDRIKRTRPSPAIVVALISLFVTLGGVAWAANTIGSADVIDNSLLSQDLKNGAGVKGIDVANDSLTGAQIAESTLGKVPNADKLDGLDSSAFARNLWAAAGYITPTPANPTGFALVRGHGATAAARIANGQWSVTFNRDITDCGYVGSAGQVADYGAGEPLYVTAGPRTATASPNDVLVRVYHGDSLIDPGGPGDGFFLAVLC